MSKIQSSIGYFEYEEFFKLFDSMVKPFFTYGAEILGFEESSYYIGNVQNKFCKKYLKLPTCTTNAIACYECG